MFFRLKKGAGNHAEPGPHGDIQMFTSQGGEIIETTSDLVKRFPEKFEQVHGIESTRISPDNNIVNHNIPPPVIPSAPEKSLNTESDIDPATETAPPAPEHLLGDEVTQRFVIAVEEQLRVFRTCRPDAEDDDYYVTELDEPNVPLNTKEPLPRNKVNGFIKKFVKTS